MSEPTKGPYEEKEKEIKTAHILWEQWEDIYQKALDELETKLEAEYKEYKENNPEEIEMMGEEDFTPSGFSNIKTISTPFGWAPIGDSVLASSRMKFWMGHTDFKITKRHIVEASKVNGVESIEIYTPHRFRLSIGLNFVDRDVMNAVESAMLPKK